MTGVQTCALPILKTYGFEEELIYSPVCDLSGGEKNLLQLAKISRTGAGLLLLDEPTSHLDTYSQLALEQQTCTCSGNLCKLEKILFSTGQITYRTVDQFFLKTIGFQVSYHLIIGIKACILKILKNSGLLIKYLPMHLGKICHLNIFAKTDCWVFSFDNICLLYTSKGALEYRNVSKVPFSFIKNKDEERHEK